ncbi:trypsin, alkaline C-like [Plutella xylostella]|uniref:trypsin, alkaline C-like n=1 Tax=Plutella xylostella TaxID=51655 RepID=UPI0020329DD0|nr:trypsin, alkaline C-like [Plutella xylostella]
MVTWAVLLLTSSVATTAVFEHNKIVGGEETTVEQYPSIVQVDFLFSTGWKQQCAGTIITSSVVVSAAHCFVEDEARNVAVDVDTRRIRAGSSMMNSGDTIVNLISFRNHPEYGIIEEDDADISLLYLAQELVFSASVQPAPIPPQGAQLPDGSAVTHAGWGLTTPGGKPSLLLREVTIYTVNHAECAHRYHDELTENMICAGILDVGGKDACQGDSGGPLYHDGCLVGVVSSGRSCAKPKYPGVSTRVSAFTTWILDNVDNAV